MTKVVALTSVSNPYVVARYSQFAKTYPRYNFALVEFGELSSTYDWQPLKQDVPYQRIVLSRKSSHQQRWFMLAIRIWSALGKLKPDIVIFCGYGVRGMLIGLLWSILFRKRAILLSETKEDDFSRVTWRESLKKHVMAQYSAFLVGGKPQQRYLYKLGANKDSIFVGYDVVGNDSFDPRRIRNLERPIKSDYFLVVSRFVPKKNLIFLLNAYAIYQDRCQSEPWQLVLCGDGELREDIEEKIENLNLDSFVHLPGFLQFDELLPYFAHAQCFIHASSQEQWGLVVNEAMASSLPVLVSRKCGCFEDLVVEGENGFGFDPNNVEELSALMAKITQDPVLLDSMGKASLKHIQNFSPSTFARGLDQAINFCLKAS